MEPKPQWCKVSALTTVLFLLPKEFFILSIIIFLNPLQSDSNSNRVYDLGQNNVLGPSKRHVNPHLEWPGLKRLSDGPKSELCWLTKTLLINYRTDTWKQSFNVLNNIHEIYIPLSLLEQLLLSHSCPLQPP